MRENKWHLILSFSIQIILIVKMPCSSCVENCSNNAKSQINLNFYGILPSGKQWRWRWLQQLVGHNSFVSFCTPSCSTAVCKGSDAVLWQNPIKYASNFHPNVFNSFYRIVTHGESHGIIYKKILLLFLMWWSPHISAFEPTSQQKSLHTCRCNFTILPPSSKTSLEDTWIQYLITNFLNINPRQYESNYCKQDLLIWSPQARFLISCTSFKL